MAQFDIYANGQPESQQLIPYLLDVQHGLHTDLGSRLVIPLVRGISKAQRIPRLCPCLLVNGEELTLSTPEMGGYPLKDLGERVGSLEPSRGQVMAAIDFLLSGF